MKQNLLNLKCSLDQAQIEDRLSYKPNILELQLFEADIDDPEYIKNVIHDLHEKGVKVILHHPMKVNGKFLDILSEDKEVLEYYERSCRVLDEICYSEDIYCVVHPHYDDCDSGRIDPSNKKLMLDKSNELKKALQKLRENTNDRFYFENAPVGIFSSMNPFWISHIIQPLNLPVCYDVSHSFMSLRGDNHKLEQDLKAAFPFTKHYHVVDSEGTEVHDALPLGNGGIVWGNLKPFIMQKNFIFEIDLPDYKDCTLMIDSAAYFESV
ncbi:TIM barrel protein [Pontibacillus sp. HMF3514]|uniref:TIM barrel protein n=1 Tax=Pontibacillus sp. HMF3514 TaxID=2692425 RepID=UPI00131F5A32|nr:TIM barrel protein [Pontibacillus sp. HMF3514]QHE51727.1 sugar phosphate isomerase/epimerase [Pontibacillus sp. HMF3514]